MRYRCLSREFVCLLAFLICVFPAIAQRKKNVPALTTPPVPSASFSQSSSSFRSGPRPYKEVITDKAITQKGLLTVHKIDDKYYVELGDSILGKDILVVNRIAKAPINTRVGFFGYAGDEINENIIRFEKGPNNKLFLRNISFSVYAKDSSKPMYKSVMNSNIQPISAAFDIKAVSTDSTGTVIDCTDFLNNDNDILFFAPSIKSALRLGGMQSDKSYVSDVRSYPINTEIRTVKTYSRSSFSSSLPGMQSAPPAGNATFELNTSIVLLPEKPMRPRFYDDRVAYLTTEYTDFDADPQGVKDISLVTRWRLEVKPEDIEKFKRGELVEPVKPIIYYIDPATPAKWIPYLIQGVNDWQKAFEKIGFKNAIIGKCAPSRDEDSTWSLEDARYSAIVYKPSEIPNAMGPHVHDPRTGEILESHINWYHNVMRLLRNWYMVQAGNIDPRARKSHFDDSLMGQLVRVVSSHEVGHALGLPHNMGASSATPVEKLRDREWLKEHGHTSSIMDYSRFNYVAQPEDKVGPEGIFPRIGDYDFWSIEWGYRYFPDKTEEQEKEILNNLVKSKYSNPRLRFIHIDGMDPRAQMEDLGDNPMKAGEYGLKNLKAIVPNLPAWLNEKGENFDALSDVYDELVTQYSRLMGHVVTYIGGIKTDYKTTDQDGAVYSIIPKSQQKEALAFLQKNVFETPTWLMNKDILDKILPPTGDRVSSMQDNILSSLLSNGRLQRMIASNNRDPQAYRIDDYMDDVRKAIWTELPTHQPIDNYRRNLQKSFVERLGNIVSPGTSPVPAGGGIVITIGPITDPKKTDIISVAKGTLKTLRADINAALPGYTDKMSRYHLQDVLERIDKVLNPK
jgi:hypothetical protein